MNTEIRVFNPAPFRQKTRKKKKKKTYVRSYPPGHLVFERSVVRQSSDVDIEAILADHTDLRHVLIKLLGIRRYLAHQTYLELGPAAIARRDEVPTGTSSRREGNQRGLSAWKLMAGILDSLLKQGQYPLLISVLSGDLLLLTSETELKNLHLVNPRQLPVRAGKAAILRFINDQKAQLAREDAYLFARRDPRGWTLAVCFGPTFCAGENAASLPGAVRLPFLQSLLGVTRHAA